ncbi:type II toxin-antitoxin system RnlA family toxin [Pseudomonas abietaniphila]|uniref:type II toxin-antitoxin system RnlA family toxin n=1 Tax=Pseudomonas abietaniphila TaxID=89065 RepID=UPI0007802CE3|nr:type II toxin-antitoxin system RnlA family toxin [Pseudomonas abietaniphila]
MSERDYRNINLNRDVIQTTVEKFIGDNDLKSRQYCDRTSGAGKRVIFGTTGAEDATLDIFFNLNGTSTLQYKMGKNQPLGQQLADALYETIHPDDFVTVNLSIKGFDGQDTDLLINELTGSADAKIEVCSSHKNGSATIWKLKSKAHMDELTITQHSTTNVLQIQGRPLSCYREATYVLTELLPTPALESVLFKKDDNRSEFIRVEVAESTLRAKFDTVYERLPQATKKLLLGGLCVRLATPVLPDYCMLVYPELRSLEGAIKGKLAEKSLETQQDTFGGFFYKTNDQFHLKSEYHGYVSDAILRGDLGAAYTFFNRNRHGLFHMEAIASGSRMISNITQAIALCDEACTHIKKLYS